MKNIICWSNILISFLMASSLINPLSPVWHWWLGLIGFSVATACSLYACFSGTKKRKRKLLRKAEKQPYDQEKDKSFRGYAA